MGQACHRVAARNGEHWCETGGVRAVGVHHVSVNVSDVPEAVAFYVDVLGLTRSKLRTSTQSSTSCADTAWR